MTDGERSAEVSATTGETIPGARPGWFAEDATPGELIRHPGARTIGPDEHIWLAWVTGNASEVHGNADRSSRGAFGGPVVLGALTVAIVAGLAGPGEPVAAHASRAAAGGWSRITLGRIVRPGDTLSATSEIISAIPTEAPAGATVRRIVHGHDQAGEEVARLEEERWVPSWCVWKNDC